MRRISCLSATNVGVVGRLKYDRDSSWNNKSLGYWVLEHTGRPFTQFEYMGNDWSLTQLIKQVLCDWGDREYLSKSNETKI